MMDIMGDCRCPCHSNLHFRHIIPCCQGAAILPYMTDGKRDYKREDQWDKNHAGRAQDRAERHKARAIEVKAGAVHKGDGKDVDHKTPLSKGGKTVSSNLRVVDASANRSFSRNSDSSLKSQTSKREASKKR